MEGNGLQGKKDHYGGIIIDSNSLPFDTNTFQQSLTESLAKWKKEGRRGVWLKIPIKLAHLIPVATQLGFEYHHAKKDYLMLTKWLPTDSPNTLPHYATHLIGVGGFVVNENKEILVIQEKNGPIKGFWKIPGGSIEHGEILCCVGSLHSTEHKSGEEITDAVVREVFEETGIKCEFVSLLCFRQTNNAAFGLSDIYIVCRLKPLNLDIKFQESEIAACKWMDATEYFNSGFHRGVYGQILNIQRENFYGRYDGFQVESLPQVFRKGNNLLYHNCTSLLSMLPKL